MRLPSKDSSLKSVALRAVMTVYVIATFVWFFWFSKESVGYFAETHDGATQVQGGTTPITIIVGVIGFVLFYLLMRTEIRIEEVQVAALWRRFASFLIDFWFFVFSLSSIGAIVPLLAEAVRTGTFKWHFERDYLVAFDSVSIVLIFAGMAAMILYFAVPLANRRQTTGCFILKIATVSGGGSLINLPLSTALWRIFKEFTGLCTPWRTIRDRDSQGRTWYDRETGFTVVKY